MSLPSFCFLMSTSGSPKTMNRLPAPVFFKQFVAHRQVGVHPRGQHGQLAVAFGLFGDVRVEGEAADQQQVEADALHRLLGRLLDLLRADRAVLRADGDGHAACVLPSLHRCTRPCGVNPLAGERIQAIELQPLALDACSARPPCAGCRGSSWRRVRADDLHLPAVACRPRMLLLLLDADACDAGERLSTVNGPLTRTRFLSS